MEKLLWNHVLAMTVLLHPSVRKGTLYQRHARQPILAVLASLISVVCVFPTAASESSLWYRQPDTETADTPVHAPSALRQYHVVWDAPGRGPQDSMPVGGGDIGANVWVENGEVLLYVQRSGAFNDTGEFLKFGRLRVALSPNPFADTASFRQELKLTDGYVEIAATGKAGSAAPFDARLRVWVDTANPDLHLDIEAEQPVHARVALESWRLKDRPLADGRYGERFGAFSVEGYPGEVIKRADHVRYQDGGVLSYQRHPAQGLLPDLFIKQQGMEAWRDSIRDHLSHRTFGVLLRGAAFSPSTNGPGEGTYLGTPFRAWPLVSDAPARRHRLVLATRIEQAPDQAAWEKSLAAQAEDALAPAVADARFAATTGWWWKFWNRSWIVVRPPGGAQADLPVWQMGRNYQLMRYQLGATSGGEFPAKFNGGNFTFDPVTVDPKRKYDPDWRAWGGDAFTAQNQRLLYWPMLKSGDFDLMHPQFKLYLDALPGATAKVREHFGHAGAMFTEYASSTGLDLGSGWGWPEPSHRARGPEVPFGDPSVNGITGYGKPVERGIMANSATSYHWESQVEHAYLMLEWQRFSGADLRMYYPFIRASLVFFDEHYQLRQKMRSGKPLDDDGKLVLFPSTSCESYRGATNPTDLVAGLRACLQSLLAIPGDLVPAADREYFAQYLARLPEISFGEEKGERVVLPAKSHLLYQNVECPQFYPLFPFNQYRLGDPEMDAFRAAWKHGTFPKGMVQSWHQDGIFFARMGLTAEAADYNTRKLRDSERRFPTFWGPGHDWVPDHNWGGSGMIGLQEMLLQTIGDQIVLFPAWPREWDVDFKLHAPGQTVVEGVLKDGELKSLNVTPPSRAKDVVNRLQSL
jgi:hypothetical protein